MTESDHAIPAPRIIVAVSGSIATYKAAELCSLLQKLGAEVRVAMTRGAAEFVTPLTFEAITQHGVSGQVFHSANSWEMEHITWARWADLLIIAPASANTLARLAHGLADDAVSSLYLAFDKPVLLAPAMNSTMLAHAATQTNLDTLRTRGHTFVDGDSGPLACGEYGLGRLAEPARIAEAAFQLLGREISAGALGVSASAAQTAVPKTHSIRKDSSLAGKTVLITSGPTHEYIDPVRFMTNPSSGRMGAALAREAWSRGATVQLVSGPVAPAFLPEDVATVSRVTTAEQMLERVRTLRAGVDIFIFAAAVSDFRVDTAPAQKIKRTGNSLTLPLVENPDISYVISAAKLPHQRTVGFAAETENIQINALAKLDRKKLDMIVANNVSNPRIGFDSHDNEVTIYRRGQEPVFVSQRSKDDVAAAVFDALLAMPPTEH